MVPEEDEEVPFQIVRCFFVRLVDIPRKEQDFLRNVYTQLSLVFEPQQFVVDLGEVFLQLLAYASKVLIRDGAGEQLLLSNSSSRLKSRAPIHERLSPRVILLSAFHKYPLCLFNDEIDEFLRELQVSELVGYHSLEKRLLNVLAAPFAIGAVVVGDFLIEMPFGAETLVVPWAGDKSCEEPLVLAPAAHSVILLRHNRLHTIECHLIYKRCVFAFLNFNTAPMNLTKIDAIAEERIHRVRLHPPSLLIS